jgi:hypothetical protein
VRSLCLLTLVVAAVSLAAPASAQQRPQRERSRSAAIGTIAPSGCSRRSDVAVLDEYCGALPTADDRGSTAPPLQSILPPGTVRHLHHAGPIGDILLSTPSGMPARAVGRRGRGQGLDANDLVRTGKLGEPRDLPRNPVAGLSRSLSDGTLNPAFGSLLLLSMIGLVGVAWQRARRRHHV